MGRCLVPARRARSAGGSRRHVRGTSSSGRSATGSRACAPGGFAEAILAGGDDARLQDDEPFVALASIIIAGLDTTVHLIGNGVAALAAHPEQLESLIDDPAGRAPGAVEEILRFDAPVRFFLRRTDDGRSIVVLYGSANRDERVFDEPDQLPHRP